MDEIRQFIPKFCEKCGNQYSFDEVNLNIELNGVTNIRCFCNKCRHQVIMRLLKRSGDISGSKQIFKSDLSLQEINKVSLQGPIDNSELLEFFESVKNVSDANAFIS